MGNKADVIRALLLFHKVALPELTTKHTGMIGEQLCGQGVTSPVHNSDGESIDACNIWSIEGRGGAKSGRSISSSF